MSYGAVSLAGQLLLVVQLPDGSTHYALPGYVNTLCGVERYTNGDVLDPPEVPTCEKCVELP